MYVHISRRATALCPHLCIGTQGKHSIVSGIKFWLYSWHMLLQPWCTVTAAGSALCCFQVGDIVQVQKDSFFPADLLLLAVPESVEGIAYVETINLDGESNLKIKKALDETQDLKLDALLDFMVGIPVVPPTELAGASMHD